MRPPDARTTTSHRLLALSGVVFAVLFLIGWFASGGDAPDYGAPDQDWTSWADDNQWKSRIGAFAMLLAGFVFLHFAGTVRAALGSAETRVRGFSELARVAFAGAITGMAGMTMAIVIISSATTEGADANPSVTRVMASTSAGPFLFSAMGFAAFLLSAGVLSERRLRAVDGDRGTHRGRVVPHRLRHPSRRAHQSPRCRSSRTSLPP